MWIFFLIWKLAKQSPPSKTDIFGPASPMCSSYRESTERIIQRHTYVLVRCLLKEIWLHCTLNFRQYVSMGLPHGVSVIVGCYNLYQCHQQCWIQTSIDWGASKKIFSALWASVWFKNKGGPRSLPWICHCSVIVYQVGCLLRVLWSLLLINIYMRKEWSAIDYYFIIVNIII